MDVFFFRWGRGTIGNPGFRKSGATGGLEFGVCCLSQNMTCWLIDDRPTLVFHALVWLGMGGVMVWCMYVVLTNLAMATCQKV